MSLTPYLLLTILLMATEWLYIRFARSFGWFDRPNERSAHEQLATVRGGGFVFYLAVIGACWIGRLDRLYFGLGLTALAAVSFRDDLKSVSRRYRLIVHMLAVGLLLGQEDLLSGNWYTVAGLVLLGVGMVNAYNFMDGINGMTALYSLITVGTLWYCQFRISAKASPLFPSVMIALLIFSVVNVRKQAIAFAGDVGSITMGFFVLYGLLEIISQLHTYLPVLFLAVYGVDSLGTICQRLYRRENIFQAHRMHLFQLLVHQLGWSHLRVSFLYAGIQASINLVAVLALDGSSVNQLVLAGEVLGGLLMGYVWVMIHIGSAKKRSVS